MEEIEQIEKEVEASKDIPLGYEEFRLSTEGQDDGAPPVFHCRNFDYDEMFELGTITEKDMAIKLPILMQKLIYEDSSVCDLSKFKDFAFTEFMARFLAAFYQSTIEIPYKVTEEDKQWVVKNLYAGNASDPRYRDWLLGIKSGQGKVSIDYDLTQLDFYPNKDYPTCARYKKTYPSGKTFEVEFSLPTFGDAAIIAKAVEEKFSETDKRYGVTYENFKILQNIRARKENGELIDNGAIPYIPESELNEVKKYELEKTKYTIKIAKGLYLKSIDGVDYSDRKLSERIEIANNDKRLDYNAFQILSDELKHIRRGIVSEIKCIHPITGERTTIVHDFRSLELFTYLQHYKSNNSSADLV